MNNADGFRPAEESDFEQVCALFAQAVGQMRQQGVDQWDERYPSREILLEDIRKGQMLLLTIDGKIASAVVLNEEPNSGFVNGDWKYTNGRIAVVHRLCVHPAFQGRGVGRQTMDFAERYLADRGYGIIRLDALIRNPRAMRLYEDLGYRRAGTEVYFHREFALLEKRLKPGSQTRPGQSGLNTEDKK